MRDQYDFHGGKRGAVLPIQKGKSRITIRLDDEVLDWFRQKVDDAGGGNYQSLINQALRDDITNQQNPLGDSLRRVIREDLQRAD